jgi:hypothetical protein
MAGTLRPEVSGGLRQPYPTAPTPLDPVEHVNQGRLFCQAPQLGGEVLLERLALLLGTVLERSVDVFRDISHKYVRHDCNMIAQAHATSVSAWEAQLVNIWA